MKRDLINSWRSRYVIIYQDRLEYYSDQTDQKTKKVISLIGTILQSNNYLRIFISILGAKIREIKRISAYGQNNYYCMMYVWFLIFVKLFELKYFSIENKFSREKTTRLASELSGEAGLSDISSWKKVDCLIH